MDRAPDKTTCRFPGDADADPIEAAFKDGVLTLTIRRTEQAKPRTVVIR